MQEQDNAKKKAARAALKWVKKGSIIGVGTGSTSAFFVEALAEADIPIAGAVASSIQTEAQLKHHGIKVIELNACEEIGVYVDGADEVDPNLNLTKGGGGALTREKIVASVALEFICIVDQSKQVSHLGNFPLPLEVLPIAKKAIERHIAKTLGGKAVLRKGFITDNGNDILDLWGLKITDPLALEETLDHIPGVVCNGLFARRKADRLIVGSEKGIEFFPN